MFMFQESGDRNNTNSVSFSSDIDSRLVPAARCVVQFPSLLLSLHHGNITAKKVLRKEELKYMYVNDVKDQKKVSWD